LRAATPPLPEGPFDLIYADPPWQVQGYAGGWGEATGRPVPYATMDLPALCRLPVGQLAAPDAVLAIWVLGAGVDRTLQVIDAWGFTDPHEGFVWVKSSKAGKPRMGMGHTTRKDSEQVWLAKRGQGLRGVDKGVAQTIVAQRREHSRKPDEAYRRLERLYGEVRRIELFSRRERPGWTRWGDQLLPPDAEPMLPFGEDELIEELRP
jgi:N6-adenosine-specific RNA methylase IME4